MPPRQAVGASGLTVSDGPNPTITLDDTAVTPGTYGDATHVAQVTFDQQGRATNATDILIPSSIKFAQTQTVTVANTVTETTVCGTGVGTLILPANFLQSGTSIKLSLLGYHSAVSNPTLRWRVKLGGTIILDTGAVATRNSTNETIEIRGFITCRTTGVSGTINAQGFYTESGAGADVYGMVNTADITVDTTGTLAFDITAEWGTASPSNTLSASIIMIDANTPN
ncbi:MAG: hypothetical protein LUO93_05790 [Methanomicrobiales archaeon]|nr:hypothetical protein [Methanomicrobiales archaeon]